MRIAIRVDASCQIGTGHFMRCLTLADVLNQQGAEIRFVSRQLPEYLRNMLVAKGYEFALLHNTPSDGVAGKLPHSSWLCTGQDQDVTETIQVLSDQTWDWLVVDHYALDAEWESAMRPEVGRIMVIDDLADRSHDCDLLLDQNLYDGLERRYNGLVPGHCVRLLGPRYALLRPEFAVARKTLRHRDGQVRRILVFFGGSDLTNETAKALEAIRLLNRPDIAVDVVIGGSNSMSDLIRKICQKKPNTDFHLQIENMAELMSAGDLAVGASGTATWERCCLGLPALIISVAYNQVGIGEAVGKCSCGIYLGESEEVDPSAIRKALDQLIYSPEAAIRIGENASRLVDGSGTNRVYENMLRVTNGLERS